MIPTFILLALAVGSQSKKQLKQKVESIVDFGLDSKT